MKHASIIILSIVICLVLEASAFVNTVDSEKSVSYEGKPLYGLERDTVELDTIPPSCGDHPDYAPLMALYHATDGPNWKNNTGWVDGAKGTNCDPCNKWKGVNCYGDGRVKDIYISYNGLKGFIPKELGDLEYLRTLDLYGNELIGTIPKELGDLEQLVSIQLGGNELSGIMPKELGQLNNLKRLILYGNRLRGFIPEEIGDLEQLEYLSIDGNEIGGTIPNELSRLINLNTLNLSKNNIEGNIPKELGALKSLNKLNLMFNELSGSIPRELLELENLSELNLSENNLSGSIPPLDKAVSLQSFYCSDNNLSGFYPSQFLCDLQYNGNKRSCNCSNDSIYYYRGFGYNLSNNPLLPWEGDYLKYCATDGSIDAQIGAACRIDGREGVIAEDGACIERIDSTSFITTWRTDHPGTSCPSCIHIPTHPRYTYDYAVDWDNDGVVDTTGIKGDFVYDFGKEGVYKVAISGEFPSIFFDADHEGVKPKGDEGKIISIDQWGKIQWKTMESAFQGCSNLRCYAMDLPYISAVTDMSNMFSGARKLNIDISAWDLTKVRSMKGIFDDSGMSHHNYDAALLRWSEDPDMPKNITLGSEGLSYCAGALARDSLVMLKGWTIAGDHKCIKGDTCRMPNGSLGELEWDCKCRRICFHPDFDPLMKLYFACGGENWDYSLEWRNVIKHASCNICTLSGVTCRDGRVVEFRSGQLVGNLPKEIGQLTKLEKLDLQWSHLNGDIPKEIAQLTELKELNLSQNNFSGIIPKELGKLENLSILKMSDNQLSGSIPPELGKLKRLTYLDLHGNQLTGSIPSFDEATELEAFFCSYNNLSGCYPSQFLCRIPFYPGEEEEYYTKNRIYEEKGYDLTHNPQLPWEGNYLRFCRRSDSKKPQIKAPCKINGKPGIINENCECVEVME